MKKFLTVLLVIAVMFTFSFGSAFAASDADASKAIDSAVTTAKDIVEGQKIDATHDYYIAPVPTEEEIKADTTLDGAKATAIRQMKANLNSAAIKMETKLKDELNDENKNAKPDAKKVSALTAAIAALDGQVAATEEVYTALINYCKSKTEVEDLTTAGGKFYDEIDTFSKVTAYSDFIAATLAQAKATLEVGAERALVVRKLNHINYISGIATANFEPKDKNGKAITATNLAGAKAWNKVSSDWSNKAYRIAK